MKNWAHIVDGEVVNVSVWDGVTPWSTQDVVVEIPEDLPVGIGWSYDGVSFVAPFQFDDPSLISG